MLKRLPLVALVLGLLLGSLLLADTPADNKKIGQLIEKLGSTDFDEREQAAQELDKIGSAALEALKQAVKSDDAEVRRQASELVSRIEKREASSLLLKPTRVTLSLKDATVDEAIAALRKQTDFPFTVVDPENKLKDVRITLELKDVAFFAALDALCEKAGLVEGPVAQAAPGFPGIKGGPLPPIRRGPALPVQPIQPGLPAPGVLPVVPEKNAPQKKEEFAVPPGALQEAPPIKRAPPVPGPATAPAQPAPAPAQLPLQPVPGQAQIQIAPGQIIIGGAGGGIAGPGGIAMPGQQPVEPGTIILTPGKPEKLPMDIATAFRVRGIPSPFQIQVPGQKVLCASLEVTPEPRYRWYGHDAVVLTKVIDDQDQKLSQFDPNAPLNVPGAGPGAPAVGIAIGFPGGFGGGPFRSSPTIPLYFKPGEKPTQSLKELSGTISARVLVPHSKAVVVDKVLEAAGKTIKGEKGGEIKIVEVTKEADAVRIKYELLPAKDAVGGENQGNVLPLPGGVFPGAPVPGIIVPPVQIAPPALPPAPPPAPNPAPAPKPEKPGFAFQVQVGQAQAGQGQALPAQAVPVQVAPIQVQIAPAPAIAPAPGAIIWGGGFGGFGMPDGLRILDEKGNPIVIAGVQQQFIGNPAGQVQRVTEIRIQQGKDQPKVDKIVWQQQKIATVDVPFTLKDVPVK
jgi:hypothetical protein